MRFCKSIKLGPVRLTASKAGLSVSGGAPGARVSVNSKGEVRRTLGIPGTGIYDTKKIGGSHAGPAGESGGVVAHGVTLDAVDAKGPGRALLDGRPDLAYLKVVEASPVDAARFAGLAAKDGWVRGIRDGVLVPQGGEYRVLMLVQREDNPILFRRRDSDNPKAMDVGRLRKADFGKWAGSFAARPVYVAVYVDATPGLDGMVEARFYPGMLAEA